MNHWHHTLTDDDVRAILRRANEPTQALALEFHCSSPTVSRIKARTRWTHIEVPK